MNKWYKGIYRRHLLDMHINEDKDVFLSKLDVNEYFNNLKRAKIESPMIYLQAHTGLCNFPTKTAKVHNVMQGDNNKIKQLIDLCKKDGMKVVGYYSLIFNNWAEDHHPEWAIRYKNGNTYREERKVRYGLCCPNNKEYRQFIMEQIKEFFAYYKNLDGVFYDMPYWEVLCHCDSCKKRFKEEYGLYIPDEDLTDEKFRKYMLARQEQMAEFCKFVKEETLKINPNVTVEYNYAAAINCSWLAGSTEKISQQSEFASGDLLGGLRTHSFACKYYYAVTNNQPFEYMNTRCDDCLQEHTISKKENKMLAEVMLNCAHHGASLSIDAINLDGTMDKRVYERLGKVFEKQLPYEKIMDKGELYSETGVYFNSDIQFSLNNRPSNKECAINAHTSLCENHIPCSIITNFTEDLSCYKTIIAPSLIKSENSLTDKLIEYVKNGGFLYISGESEPQLIKEFFDAEIVTRKISKEKGHRALCYVSPKEELVKKFGEFTQFSPLPLSYYLPEIKFGKGKVLATVTDPITDPEDNLHFGSIHSNPPAILTDKPAIIETNYGKGKVLWSLAEIEADDREGFAEVFVSLISTEAEKPLFSVKANKNVEVVTFKDKNTLYLGFYNYGYESMPDIENAAEITFNRPVKISAVNGENITVKENSFKIKFNIFGCVKVDLL